MISKNRRLLVSTCIGLATVAASGAAQVRSTPEPTSNWGRFVGTVETRWEDDGRNMTPSPSVEDLAEQRWNVEREWQGDTRWVPDNFTIEDLWPFVAWAPALHCLRIRINQPVFRDSDLLI